VFGFGPDLIFWIPGFLLAIVIHEYAHARAAVALGDPTPAVAGRLTLNPIPHIDPFGLIMLVLFKFGWAKPVPINPYNFRNGRRDMVLVSLAGPGSNIALAFVCWFLYALLIKFNFMNTEISLVLINAIKSNMFFAVFNLIPLPPLDGSQIVSSLLPGRQAYAYESIAPYGPWILMALIYLGVIGGIVDPIVRVLAAIIQASVALIL
jgi:Zn-dependent protease